MIIERVMLQWLTLETTTIVNMQQRSQIDSTMQRYVNVSFKNPPKLQLKSGKSSSTSPGTVEHCLGVFGNVLATLHCRPAQK